jgi:hypothetical protein
MKDALKIIISKSPVAADDALDCLKAIRAKSPMVGRRYEHTAQLALTDPQAEWTPADRALIASYIAGDDDSDSATKMRSIRLSNEDWARAQAIGDGNAAAGIRLALREYRQ